MNNKKTQSKKEIESNGNNNGCNTVANDIFQKIIQIQGYTKDKNDSEKLKKKIPLKILFVCSGNICRSAYAEFVFKKIVKESEILKGKIEVKSGGVTFRNDYIDERTVAALKKEGISESLSRKHIPRYIKDYPEIFDEADIIIGMTKSHKIGLPKEYRKGENAKFVRLAEIAANEPLDIDDPYFTSNFEEFSEIMNQIKKYLLLLKEKLENFYSN
ncbi:MAG: arsenate reductase/protein-tyrosine-phosphatase family protein [Promethearchaeota archaeon]